ncbi:MAG TPA: hypothetical protein VN893_19700 [Bryobacteraceae bacterium]|nr:hypothetical protein [Bryobacteraceae bacterium]
MRTCTLIALLSCALLIPAAAPAADSSLLRLAPADSEALIGINIRQILASDFGKMVMAQMAGPSHPEVKAFSDQAGFDPMRDLEEVLIAAPAKQNPSALFLMRGKFDVAKLAQLAAMGGMKGADYKGVQVMVRSGQKGGFSAVAVMDPTLIVGGDEPGVRAFVDRSGTGAGLGEEIAAKASEASKANDIWMVVHAAPSAFSPQGANPGAAGKVMESIEQASLGVKFGSDIVVWVKAVTHTPEDAAGLVSALQFFSSMAASQKSNAQMTAMLQRLKIGSEGNTAKISLTIPEADAEAAVRDAMASGKKQSKNEPNVGWDVTGGPAAAAKH